MTGGSKNKEIRAKAALLAGFPLAEEDLLLGMLEMLFFRKLRMHRLCVDFHVDEPLCPQTLLIPVQSGSAQLVEVVLTPTSSFKASSCLLRV